jgi:Protein of unknown function (DUF2568)
MVLTTIKNTNLALAFLLELGVLAALGFWGFSTGSETVAKVVPGIGLPLVAIVVWGLFGSPKAMWHLNGLWRLLLQIVFFGSAAVSLFSAGQRVLGSVFALLFVLNTTLLYVWGQ